MGSLSREQEHVRTELPITEYPNRHSFLTVTWTIQFRRKTQQGDTGKPQGPSNYEEELNGEYRKIHKVLGATNKNKDLRNQVKEQVDERIENQLTIGMNLTINPV